MKRMFSKTKQAALLSLVLYAGLAYAIPNPDWALSALNQAGTVLANLFPVLIGLALLVFIWGVVQFVITDDDKKRSEGKRRMALGLIGLFAIISVWGLVILLQTFTGVRNVVVNPPLPPG